MHRLLQDGAGTILPKAFAPEVVAVERIRCSLSRRRLQPGYYARYYLRLRPFQEELGPHDARGVMRGSTNGVCLHCRPWHLVRPNSLGDAFANDSALADATKAKGWARCAICYRFCVSGERMRVSEYVLTTCHRTLVTSVVRLVLLIPIFSSNDVSWVLSGAIVWM